MLKFLSPKNTFKSLFLVKKLELSMKTKKVILITELWTVKMGTGK